MRTMLQTVHTRLPTVMLEKFSSLESKLYWFRRHEEAVEDEPAWPGMKWWG
jgi:hypothetical protein